MPSEKARIQFIIDQRGRRIRAVLPLKRYRELLEAEEELEAIRAYDQARASEDEAIPFEQALREIEAQRRCRTKFSSSEASRKR